MEKVLMIIGNGFDLSHRLPTSYTNFKNMLVESQKQHIIDKVIEQSRIEKLCKDIDKLQFNIDISKDELKCVLRENRINEYVCRTNRFFLDDLYGKTYPQEFLEERGFPLGEEFDNEKIQEVIRAFEKIIDEIYALKDKCKRSKEICVLHNIPYDEMDEIDRIEFILRTFEEIEFLMNEQGKSAWGCFEESCGIIDFEFFLNQIPDGLFDDKEGDLDEWLRDDLLQPMICPYVSVLQSLPMYFTKWINSIDTEKAILIKDFKNFFEKYDVCCLNFNYTDTVEKKYGQSVFHIHGKQNEEIHVGHGNDEIFIDESNIVLECAMNDIRAALKKDTRTILENAEKNFFSTLDSSIQKIFVYGFSFGEVDNPYLIRINSILPKAQWYVQSYLSEDFSVFKARLLSLGVEELRIHHWHSVSEY